MPATATKVAETITMIPVSQLRPHPKNPRVALRQDVVDAIAVDLSERGYMEARHALTVRRVDDGYEIISGHHRHASAQAAGLEEVPCWVVEMDDDQAYMALATSNNQGELAALEIGLHALDAVPLEKGVKGGGLAAYAKKIGKQKQHVSTYRKGAEVYRHVATTCNNDVTGCRDKAHHLGCIADEDRRDLWPALVSSLLSCGWSVADTEHWVGKVGEFYEPEGCGGWLPLVPVVERFLTTKEFSPKTIGQLVDERNAIVDLIYANATKIEEAGQVAAAWADELERWLVANMGGKSWDVRELVAYRLQIEQRLNKCGPNQWLHGNWRDHVDAIKDGSISVFLTDPPYGMDYQSNYRLDTRKARKHEKIANDGDGQGPAELAECVAAFMPKLASDSHVFVFTNWRNEEAMRCALAEAGLTVKGSLVWVKNNTGMGDLKGAFAPKHERIVHAVKGSPILFEREADVLEYDRVSTDRHPTEKPVDLLERLIEVTSVEGQRVADPFAGVGSTCEAAASTGRHYWGCELKDEYYEHGKARLDGLEQVGD
jgi:DNA modification methylase/ParB-like chromosome segregation protein Spo0J